MPVGEGGGGTRSHGETPAQWSLGDPDPGRERDLVQGLLSLSFCICKMGVCECITWAHR